MPRTPSQLRKNCDGLLDCTTRTRQVVNILNQVTRKNISNVNINTLRLQVQLIAKSWWKLLEICMRWRDSPKTLLMRERESCSRCLTRMTAENWTRMSLFEDVSEMNDYDHCSTVGLDKIHHSTMIVVMRCLSQLYHFNGSCCHRLNQNKCERRAELFKK